MEDQRTLATSFGRRAATLCALYFAQGVPWGFVTISLVAYLNEHGIPRQETAILISMSILPWTFKLIWGPMIDSFQLRSFGRRRPWILFAQAMMAVTLLAASTTRALTDPETVGFLAAVFFIHNCFAALQDVATDALAIDILPPSERGRMNGFMWGSKLIGISIGGAVLATVIVRFGLTVGVQIQALVVLLIMLLPLLLRERPGDRLFPWSNSAAGALAATGGETSDAGPISFAERLTGPFKVLRELGRAFSLRTTLLAGVVALAYMLAEGFHDASTPAVFTQTFGWSTEAYARLQGVWGTAGKLIGALLGGYLCDRYGRRLIAGIFASSVAVVFVAFGLALPWVGNVPSALALFIFLVQGSLAAVAVAMFSLFMKISWTTAAASQFTLLMTLSNMGYAAGPLLTRLHLSDAQSYIVAGAAAILPMVLLPLMAPERVEKRKKAELRVAVSQPA